MVFRVVVCIMLVGAGATAQSRIERGNTTRVPGGLVSALPADPETRGTIVRVNGRRTTVVRLDNAGDAIGRGFTASELALLGVFAVGGTIANAVVGYARDSAANVLPGAATQLRDFGRGSVVAHTRTNAGGQFGFPGLPTGTYIVELLSPDAHVVALSDAVSVGSGQIVQTVVQMSAPTRSFAAWLGGATTSAVNSAVEAGVLGLEAGPAASPES